MKVSVRVSGRNESCSKELIHMHTVKQLALPAQSLDVAQLATTYGHLRGLPVSRYVRVVPRVLIGADNCHLSQPMKILKGKRGEPVACRTRLGWLIYGPYAVDREVRHAVIAKKPTCRSHRTIAPISSTSVPMQNTEHEIDRPALEFFVGPKSLCKAAAKQRYVCLKTDKIINPVADDKTKAKIKPNLSEDRSGRAHNNASTKRRFYTVMKRAQPSSKQEGTPQEDGPVMQFELLNKRWFNLPGRTRCSSCRLRQKGPHNNLALQKSFAHMNGSKKQYRARDSIFRSAKDKHGKKTVHKCCVRPL